MKKKSFLIELGIFLLVLFFTLPVQGQKAEVLKKIQSGTYSNSWDLVMENEKIAIFTKYSDCSQPSEGFFFEYLLFKVENKTGNRVYVTWDFDYSYDNKTRDPESDDEIFVNCIVEPLTSVEASCLSNENRHLRLFVREKNKAGASQLTNFSINSLKISNL